MSWILDKFITPFKGYIYGGLLVAILLLCAYAKHYINTEIEAAYNNGYNKAVVEQQQVQLQYTLEYAKEIRDAAQQHQKDINTISNLHSTISGLQVDVPEYSCSSSTGTSESGDKGSRIFPNKIQTAFDNFTAGVAQLILECDQLNVNAIEVNGVK